jgi:dolichol-phosphate mannosyltransferase
VVLAVRRQRQDRFLKRLTSRLFYKVFSYLADMDYDGRTGNFRIVSRKVVVGLRAMREQLRFFGGLVSWMGFPTASIDVQHNERFAGETSYTYRKLWKLATETIIAHSDKPLHLAIRLGFMISAIAFGYGGYIVYRSFVYDISIMGWGSLIVSLYFLGGIIISILGVLGVYLGKTFDEAKRRPLYIIRHTTFDDDSSKR